MYPKIARKVPPVARPLSQPATTESTPPEVRGQDPHPAPTPPPMMEPEAPDADDAPVVDSVPEDNDDDDAEDAVDDDGPTGDTEKR
jgi:hypothetical protein